MRQLRLFNDAHDMQYAMSLTSHELGRIKQVAPESYMFIKFIRDAVHKHEAVVRHSASELQQKFSRFNTMSKLNINPFKD